MMKWLIFQSCDIWNGNRFYMEKQVNYWCWVSADLQNGFNTDLYHWSIAPVIAIPPGTWKDMRPKKFIRSPVSGWNAESTRCFACHRSSMDKLDTLPCLTRNQEWIHVQWKTSYQQQLVAFNKASKGWLKKTSYRTGSQALRLTPHLEAVGITLLLVYAVVPQSFLPKETIQCGGAWTGPTGSPPLVSMHTSKTYS